MAARVALVVSRFPRGSETFVASKFAGLLERGWDVHAVCAESDERDWKAFPVLGRSGIRSRVHRTWPDRPRWMAAALVPAALLRCLAYRPRLTWRYLAKGWRRFGPGILRHLYLDAELVRLAPALVHFEFGALAVGRTHLRDLLGCRILISFRGYDLNFAGADDPDYYDEVWRAADALHLLGEHLWRVALRRGCPPEKRHELIPPAIDTEFFRPADATAATARAEGPLRILSVGRLEWKKGYEDAMLAVRRLLDRGVACTHRIAGAGDYGEALAFARHQLGLEGVVEFVGALPASAVRDEMGQADVFLHAAVSEGFCNAVVEAQAMGVPVVCTDAGGLPANVADGESGFVVPRRDPGALADRLSSLARDPALRRRMGEAGRRRALARFRLEDQLDAFERLYRELLELPAVRQERATAKPLTVPRGDGIPSRSATNHGR